MSLVSDSVSSAKTFVDRLIPRRIPGHHSKKEEALSKSDLWQVDPTLADIRKLMQRQGIARKLVNKISSDTFDKWFTLESENKKLVEDVHTLFSSKNLWFDSDGKKRLGFKKLLKKAYQTAMSEGYVLIGIGFSDDLPLEKRVENPRSIEYLSLITKSEVNKLIIDEDTNSETYGELIGAEVRIGKGNVQTIHASRFIYLPVNVYGNMIEGLGYVKPSYNYLVVLENVIWSTGQAFYRYAAGFTHVKKSKATNNQIEDLRLQFANINSLSGWVSRDDLEIDQKGAKGKALDPEQYWNVSVKAVAMSFEIPKDIVEGISAGAVTGSETNLKDYYSDISSKQDEDITPILEQFIRIAQLTGQVSEGEFNISWNPLFEMDEKERAEINKINAETNKILIELGIKTPEEAREEMETKKMTDSRTDALLETEKEPDIGARPFTFYGKTNLEPEEILELEEEFKKELSDFFQVKPIMRLIAEADVIGVITDSNVKTDGFPQLKKSLEEYHKSREYKMKATTQHHINKAWALGIEKSEQLLDMNIISSTASKNVKKILQETSYTFISSTGKDVTKKTLFEVEQGILQGESTNQIKKRIVRVINVAKHNAETTARTYSHRALTRSIHRSYKDSGIVKGFEYVTAGDDAVRDSHASLNGKYFDVDDYPEQLDEPNCRCTIFARMEGT